MFTVNETFMSETETTRPYKIYETRRDRDISKTGLETVSRPYRDRDVETETTSLVPGVAAVLFSHT